jgi:hypothetical protein
MQELNDLTNIFCLVVAKKLLARFTSAGLVSNIYIHFGTYTSHTLQFRTARTKSSQFAVSSPVVAW